MSGSGIGWAICKSAPRCRQVTTPAPHHSVFYWLDALPAAQQHKSAEDPHVMHGLLDPTKSAVQMAPLIGSVVFAGLTVLPTDK